MIQLYLTARTCLKPVSSSVIPPTSSQMDFMVFEKMMKYTMHSPHEFRVRQIEMKNMLLRPRRMYPSSYRLSGFAGIRSFAFRYSQILLRVWIETSSIEPTEIHKPNSRKAYGNPTIPPPTIVEIMVSTAPKRVNEWSLSG